MMDNPLQQAIAAIKAGDKSTGKRLLAQVLQADPHNEAAWLWLSYAVDNVAQKRQCLERVLKLNPANQTARRQLGAIDHLEAATVQPVQVQVTPPSARKPKKRKGLIIGLIAATAAAVVCVSLVGIWWAVNSGLLQLGAMIPVASTPTAIPLPTIPPGWHKYTHFTGSFSVHYPPSWKVKGESSNSVSFEAPDFSLAGVHMLSPACGIGIAEDEKVLNCFASMMADAVDQRGDDFRVVRKYTWDEGEFHGYVIENILRMDTYNGEAPGYDANVYIQVSSDTMVWMNYFHANTESITTNERADFKQFVFSIVVNATE